MRKPSPWSGGWCEMGICIHHFGEKMGRYIMICDSGFLYPDLGDFDFCGYIDDDVGAGDASDSVVVSGAFCGTNAWGSLGCPRGAVRCPTDYRISSSSGFFRVVGGYVGADGEVGRKNPGIEEQLEQWSNGRALT
ncbi:hypothetical protein DPMN_009176 [Dreissena polymorpha]|uniref:Uncharacterized protein n=1 Tax=Dreissena polymorpha TaxID=45954 RepID=A0A9D4MXK6_DREPO|nr:hypothetical protein DPMN_009176 [Dreissena polymorpha]